jgi:hypothetical protein
MPAGLQVLATVPLAFGKYSVDFEKIALYYNGNPVYSWVESISNGSMNVWLKMPVSIPANTSITINAIPYNKTVFDNNYWGCAPTLTNQYGQYDNGANVFDFYDNFAGTTLNASKWSEYINGGINISVNNGLTMTQTGGRYNNQGIIGNTAVSIPAIIESYGQIPQDQNTGYDVSAFGFMANLTVGYQHVAIGTNNVVGTIYIDPIFRETITDYNSYAVSNHIWSVWYNGSTITAQMDYGDTYTYSYSTTSALYPAFYLESNGNSKYTSQWVRVRAYPPNGVMPSVTVSY